MYIYIMIYGDKLKSEKDRQTESHRKIRDNDRHRDREGETEGQRVLEVGRERQRQRY